MPEGGYDQDLAAAGGADFFVAQLLQGGHALGDLQSVSIPWRKIGN